MTYADRLERTFYVTPPDIAKGLTIGAYRRGRPKKRGLMFWINGWWTQTFEQAKKIAAKFAGTKGYQRISFSETGAASELTHYASLHKSGWALVEQYA